MSPESPAFALHSGGGAVFCSTSMKFTPLTLQLFNVYLTKGENQVSGKNKPGKKSLL